MSKWFVQLKGAEFDLEELPKRFNSSEIKISKKDGDFILESSYFDLLNDERKIRKKALNLIQMINGTMTISMPSFNPISLLNITEKSGSNTTVHLKSSDELKIRSKATTSSFRDGKKQKQNRNTFNEEAWISLSSEDEYVKKVLRLFSKNLNWNTLYKVFEVIQSDVGSKISKEGWMSKGKINLFKHTANSPEVLGDDARHGRSQGQPPSDPMKLSKAKHLINTLIKKWIQDKLKYNSPS